MPSINFTKLCMEEEDPMLNEEVRCNHGFLVPLMTAWTEKNPGRRYWVCPYYGRRTSCDFWRWRDEEIDPRSKFVVPILTDKIKELERRLEVYEKMDKPRATKQVENRVELQMEKLQIEIGRMKEKDNKWKSKLKRSEFRENLLWLIIICFIILGLSSRFQVMHLKKDVTKLP